MSTPSTIENTSPDPLVVASSSSGRPTSLPQRGSYSPIDKLPTETYREIFRWAVTQDYSGLLWNNSNDPHLLVRTGSLVSRYWRDVIRTCSFLWSHVDVVRKPHMSEDEKVAAWKFLGQSIFYSGNAPLYIRVNMECPSDDLGERCIQFMAMNAHRWREFECRNEDLFNAIISQIPTESSFDKLQVIDFYGGNHSFSLRPVPELRMLRAVNQLGLIILQSSTPSLTEIHLARVPFPLIAFRGISWVNITRFISDGCEYKRNELHIILENMPNLKYLLLHGETNTDVSTTLPQLETLDLAECTECNALKILVTPRLTKLQLFQEFDPVDLIELIRRSGCTLEILLLEDACIMEEWNAPEFSTIHSFVWKYPRRMAEGIESLTFRNALGIPDIFPRLRNFEMNMIGYHASTADDDESVEIADELIEMLESRLSISDQKLQPDLSENVTVNPLTTPRMLSGYAYITFAFDVDEDSIDKFDEFLTSELVGTSGVDIIINYDGQHCGEY